MVTKDELMAITWPGLFVQRAISRSTWPISGALLAIRRGTDLRCHESTAVAYQFVASVGHRARCRNTQRIDEF